MIVVYFCYTALIQKLCILREYEPSLYAFSVIQIARNEMCRTIIAANAIADSLTEVTLHN